MKFLRLLPIIATLGFLAGCGKSPETKHELPVLSGDAFDLLRHLQDRVKSESSYYRNRRDEAQRALDHLKRIADGEQDRKIAQSLEIYLASIDSERAIVDKRKSALDSMRSLSINYPYISNCKPPNPSGSPCAKWLQLKAELAKLDVSIAQENARVDAVRAEVSIK